MTRKKIKIGLFGFGCVGYGLYEVLAKTPGLKAEIKYICVKQKEKERRLPQDRFIYDKDQILSDPEINVVVELIDDAEAAYDIVTTALKNGKAVVSANKKLIAEHLPELLQLQKDYNVPFLYEAACCASIPIIRNLEEYYDNDLLESIEGIVNGSTNYILTKTSEEHLSYAQALQQAQQQGFAESDPSLDTSGLDAKYKLVILLAHAFGIVVSPDEIFNLGIDRIGEVELAYAREKKLKIKLVAKAYKTGEGRVACFVLPKFVGVKDKLYNVDDVFNGIITKTSFADTQFFVGKGAGAHPTASAVLSDLSALSYDYRYEYKKIGTEEKLQPAKNIFLRVFLRYEPVFADAFKEYFEEIHECYNNHNSAFITGVISLQKLSQITGLKNLRTSVILFDVDDRAEFRGIATEVIEGELVGQNL